MSLFARLTGAAVIIYATTVPLILPLACVAFGVLWVSTRYTMMYVNSSNVSTDGSLYAVAVRQLFVGVYVMEIYMLGLFTLRRDGNGAPASLPQATLMALVLAITILYQSQLSRFLDPLLVTPVPRKHGAVTSVKWLENPTLTARRRKIWIPSDASCYADRQIQKASMIYRGALPIGCCPAALDNTGKLVVPTWDLPQEYDVQP